MYNKRIKNFLFYKIEDLEVEGLEIRPNTKPPVVVSREEMMRQWELAGENRQLLQHRMGHPARA